MACCRRTSTWRLALDINIKRVHIGHSSENVKCSQMCTRSLSHLLIVPSLYSVTGNILINTTIEQENTFQLSSIPPHHCWKQERNYGLHNIGLTRNSRSFIQSPRFVDFSLMSLCPALQHISCTKIQLHSSQITDVFVFCIC